ncbi:hypothetical protein ACWEP3_12805, partial [Streptomyces albidoflavus]
YDATEQRLIDQAMFDLDATDNKGCPDRRCPGLSARCPRTPARAAGTPVGSYRPASVMAFASAQKGYCGRSVPCQDGEGVGCVAARRPEGSSPPGRVAAGQVD